MGERVNPDDSVLRELLGTAKTIAVVGLSGNPARDSYQVAAYLQENGYRVIPVNPGVVEVLGERAYASLLEVPDRVDIVDVFRRPEEAMPAVEQAVKIGVRAVWLQVGVVNQEAAAVASRAGLLVVMDRCIKREHRRLCRGEGGAGD